MVLIEPFSVVRSVLASASATIRSSDLVFIRSDVLFPIKKFVVLAGVVQLRQMAEVKIEPAVTKDEKSEKVDMTRDPDRHDGNLDRLSFVIMFCVLAVDNFAAGARAHVEVASDGVTVCSLDSRVDVVYRCVCRLLL